MTESEQAAYLGETAYELSKLRRELACLKSSCDIMRRQMQIAISLLETTENFSGAQSSNSPDASKFPSHGEVMRVSNEIENTRRRIAYLKSILIDAGVLSDK